MTNATQTFKQGIPSTFGEGGSGLTPGGSAGRPDLKEILWSLLDRIHAPVAARSDLDAIGGAGTNPVSSLYTGPASALDCADGMRVLVMADNSQWRYDALSTVAGDAAGELVRVPADSRAAGRFIRVDKVVDLKLPIAFGTADAAVLWTVPTGFKVLPISSFFEVTTSFTGGASSAIGGSSSNAGCSTKGDLLGGSSGSLAAALVSTAQLAKGTKGTKIGTPICLVAGDTIRHDLVTSQFTAGAGFAHYQIALL